MTNKRIEAAVQRLNRGQKSMGKFPQKPLSAGRFFPKKRDGVLTRDTERDMLPSEVRNHG